MTPDAQDLVLAKLKTILLEDEQRKLSQIEQEIGDIRSLVSEQNLSSVVEPIIEQKFDSVQEQMRSLAGQDLTQKIREQIRDNRDEMIDALYPIIGKMVQKYIQMELEKLSERIDNQINDTFSFQAIKREFLSLFGIKENAMILQNIMKPVVEEVFVIEQHSGLLVAHYSKESAVDEDMIAGMLTAIKSFVEDSFSRKDGNLDTIEYGTLKIMLQNYSRFFVVAVVSGTVDSAYKLQLLEALYIFGKDHLIKYSDEQLTSEELSSTLKQFFIKFDATR